MKTVKFLTVVCLLICLTVGCKEEKGVSALQTDTSVITSKLAVDLSVAKTIGNNTYIPLNFDGSSCQIVSEILRIKNVFEKAHPELEITSWETNQSHASYFYSPRVYGLWAHHKPKK